MEWLNIFKNEHVFDDNLANHDFERRLHFVAAVGIVHHDKEKDEISYDKSKQSPVLTLFTKMGEVFVDTYFVILLVAEAICGKYMIMKQKDLIDELHHTIKYLHEQ